MPATAEIETDETTNVEDPSLKALEARIDADERDFAAQRAQKARDDGRDPGRQRGTNGKFTSAKQPEGQRAAPESSAEEIAAGAGTTGKPAEAAPGATAAETSSDKTTTTDKEQGKTAAEAVEDESKLSPYERAKRREAKAWKAINEQKLANEAKAAELAAREQAVMQRASATRTEPQPADRYTPADYLEAAAKFEARAKRFEAAGDFDAADREMVLARAAREEASRPDVGRQSAAGGTTPDPRAHEQALARNWETLKNEMPELLDPNGDANKETIALLKANPGLLNDPAGPYRAVIQAGRKVVGKLKAEAARVPELTKQVETLSKRVKELEALTSLPGGGGPNGRGSSGGEVDFAELPADKREAQLRADLAATRG